MRAGRNLALVLAASFAWGCGAPGSPPAQPASWIVTLGGLNADAVNDVVWAGDGLLAAGSTLSAGAGDYDVWIVKLTGRGDVVWQKTLGGPDRDTARAIVQTTGGSFFVVGGTSTAPLESDLLVAKADAAGNPLWQRTLGDAGYEVAGAAAAVADGLVVVGSRNSGTSPTDMWVVRLDAAGNVLWQKTLGGTFRDAAGAVLSTRDGHLVVGGYTSLGVSRTNDRTWIVKLDGTGNVVWQKTLDDTDVEGARAIVEASDGGYFALAETMGATQSAARVVRLDEAGNVVWQRTYSLSQRNGPDSAVATSDGGVLFAATVEDLTAGNMEQWLVRLDGAGNVLWQRVLDGPQDELDGVVVETPDAVVLAGDTRSWGAGDMDGFVARLTSDGRFDGACSFLLDPAPIVPQDGMANIADSTAVAVDSTAVAAVSSFAWQDSAASPAGVCPQ